MKPSVKLAIVLASIGMTALHAAPVLGTVESVPEPAAWTLCCLGGLILLAVQRARRKP